MTTQPKTKSPVDFPIAMASSVWDEAMTRTIALSQEISSFVMARVSEDVGAWTRLASCKDAAQLMDCQQQYARKAAEDYAAEGQKLCRMLTEQPKKAAPAAA